MITTVIKVNGMYYVGESEEFYTSDFKGVGWQDYKGNELSVLIFSLDNKEAKIIEGSTNLKSVIDKVMQRVRDGYIEMQTIEIINSHDLEVEK